MHVSFLLSGREGTPGNRWKDFPDVQGVSTTIAKGMPLEGSEIWRQNAARCAKKWQERRENLPLGRVPPRGLGIEPAPPFSHGCTRMETDQNKSFEKSVSIRVYPWLISGH
jgi:hypothetical protein